MTFSTRIFKNPFNVGWKQRISDLLDVLIKTTGHKTSFFSTEDYDVVMASKSPEELEYAISIGMSGKGVKYVMDKYPQYVKSIEDGILVYEFGFRLDMGMPVSVATFDALKARYDVYKLYRYLVAK